MINTGHYYGDVVRRFFLAGGALMLISLPFLQSFIPFPIFTSILAILIITLCAGLMAPTQKWAMILDLVVAALAMIEFEYYAVFSYLNGNTSFFLANQALAVIFFAAFYFSVKTVRGSFMKREG